jgi:uncharacterized membrane protein YfcA
MGADWTEAAALAAAFTVALVAAPAGISGAVLLLPFQVSVLGTPSPAVTPTNLLYNVIATPGALYRFWRQGQTGGGLALVLITGTLPGVVAGSVIRAEVLPGPRVFGLVVAAVLAPLGVWLALTRPPETARLTEAAQPPTPRQPPEMARLMGAAQPATPGQPPTGRPPTGSRPPAGPGRAIPLPALVGLAALAGCVGGLYGIGGGSILAPVLIGTGRPASQVAPAALASTLVTSVAGVVTFTVLSLHQAGPVAPDWPTGIALGAGGLIGGYAGARIQSRLPELLIRRLIGVLVIAIAARYLWQSLG